MISEAAAARMLETVDEAVRAGAEIIVGGHREGAYVEPTILMGVPRTVTTSGTGVYAVAFDGTHPAIRSVQITGYGSNSNTCKVGSWGASTVTVLCFTAAGVAVNSNFTITVAN